MTLNQIIKTRQSKGLTQRKLAKLIKKGPTFISKLERKERLLTPELKKSLLSALRKTKALKTRGLKLRVKK